MVEMMSVVVLRTVRIADGANIYGREIVAGTPDEIPADLFDGLEAAGYVAAPGAVSNAAPEIPDDWRSLHHMKLIALARQYDENVASKDAAVDVLEKAVASAAQNKAIAAAPENKGV